MKIKMIVSALVLVSTFALAKKQSASDITKCAERIQTACHISNNDEKRIKENAVVCKQVQSFGEKMEAVVLESGDVTVVQVSNNCAITKYDLGYGIQAEDLKVIDGRAYMSTKSGAVYYFRANSYGAPSFFEVLTSKKHSYVGVDTVKGVSGGQAVQFLDKNENPMPVIDGKDSVSGQEIEDLNSKGRLRALNFWPTTADRSLFRN